MKQDIASKIMDKVESFPSIPGSAVKLMALLDDPESTAAQLEEVLKYDAGLTANILRLSNSAYFGMMSRIGSVKQAVVTLGLKRIKQLVLTSCIGAVLDKHVAGYDMQPGELWRHSIAVSVAAEGLIAELEMPGGDDIFTASLLHDVGKLVMGEFVRSEMENIRDAASNGVPFEVAENMVLGMNHADVGATILKSWSFPDSIIDAVRWHHNPEKAQEQNATTDIVHVADILSLMVGIGLGSEGLKYELLPSVTERLGLGTAHLEAVASRTLQAVNELSELLTEQ
jgi:putative nucleotidyltransferase with HDIG domain